MRISNVDALRAVKIDGASLPQVNNLAIALNDAGGAVEKAIESYQRTFKRPFHSADLHNNLASRCPNCTEPTTRTVNLRQPCRSTPTMPTPEKIWTRR